MTDHNPLLLNKQSCQLEVARPVWLPYNDIAHDLVGALVGQFGYPTSGPKAQKYAVVDDFLGHFGGQLVEGSGTSGLHKDDQGKWRTDPKMSMYTLDLAKLPKQLLAARFIEVSRPFQKPNFH